MSKNRGVTRPASIPSPGKSHAHGAAGGYVTGTTGKGGPMTGTGGVKTHAHGKAGGLVQPKGMASKGGSAQSGKAAG